MTSLLGKGLLIALSFIVAICPAWSKSLGVASGIFTGAGLLNFGLIKTVLSYSPLFFVIDIAFSVIVLYYFKKVFKHGTGR